MFDISFTEILVIAIIALVILGPERLPQVARTLGHLFGRAQRYVNDVKSDIHREMELDELRKLKTSVQEAAHSLEGTIRAGAEITPSQGVTETESIIAATSVPPPGIATEISPSSDSLATPTKPAKPLVRLKSNPDDAAGADIAHS